MIDLNKHAVRESAIVYVKTEFIGFHRWKDAPASVGFLRDWHRHVFKVTAAVRVSHGNRDVEFITLRKQVDNFLRDAYTEQRFEESCEQIAVKIGSFLLSEDYIPHSVEVSEDGENGGVVVFDYVPIPSKE